MVILDGAVACILVTFSSPQETILSVSTENDSLQAVPVGYCRQTMNPEINLVYKHGVDASQEVRLRKMFKNTPFKNYSIGSFTDKAKKKGIKVSLETLYRAKISVDDYHSYPSR